ncbi:MAG: hypothetical protein ACPGVY_02885 [Mycobacterium sp.]
MEATPLEPDSELATARTMPIAALGWGALTGWAAWKGRQDGWEPLWLYPALLAAMGAGLLLLVVVAVRGLREYRALRFATVQLDRPFLTIGEPAALSAQTGANPGAPLHVDVHLEGREYTRDYQAKNVASGSGGGLKIKDRLVYRECLGDAAAAEGARLDHLSIVVPSDIHPSVAEKPHGIDWALRIRIKSGTAPSWDAQYPVRIRGRNGSGVSLDSKRQEFQFPKISGDPLPEL